MRDKKGKRVFCTSHTYPHILASTHLTPSPSPPRMGWDGCGCLRHRNMDIWTYIIYILSVYIRHRCLHLVRRPGLQCTPLDAQRDGGKSAASFRINYGIRYKLWPIMYQKLAFFVKQMIPNCGIWRCRLTMCF